MTAEAWDLEELLRAQPPCRSGCGRLATQKVHGACWSSVYCDGCVPQYMEPTELPTAAVIRRLGR